MPIIRRNSQMNFPLLPFARAFFLFIPFSHFLSVSAQVGPGGVTTNMRGWYDASSNITLTGGAVSAWGDRSGNGLHGSQGTAANRPVVNATGFNYNQTLSFDGQTDFISIPDQMPSTSTGVTAFAVVRQTATTRDAYGMILVGQASTTGSGGGFGLIAAVPGNNVHGFAVNNYAGNSVFAASTLSEPTLMTGNFNGTTPGSVQYFRNGANMGTDAYAGQVGDNGSSFIGSAETAGGFCFYGNIAEIAIFSAGLNAANTSRVESYLALKYGLTKSGNYVNTAGTTVYTNAAPYNNDIIGIGRDDNTALNQKQSRAYDDSCRVFIGTLAASNSANGSTFSSNNQYIVLGHNNDRLSAQFTEKPASVYSRLRREWKVTNTGFNGTFSFSVRLNSIAVPGNVNQAHIRLLVDTDGNFSNATVINPSVSYAGGIITISGIGTTEIPANSTRYITVASANSNSPLPVELLSFETLVCGPQACIRWKTASEKNNEGFEVQRSTNGTDWRLIHKVKGAGNSVTARSYETIDISVPNGTSYYRLKQVDTDGGHAFSPISSVFFQGPARPAPLLAYPNPADKELLVPGYIPSQLRLFDPLGMEIPSTLLSSSEYQDGTRISMALLPEGIYILTIDDAAVPRQSLRIIVSHR